jgi:threonyl-tRNA synthetase
VNELRGEILSVVNRIFFLDKINCKIQETEKAKVHTMLVIGACDIEVGNVSVRLHGKGSVGAKPKGEVIAEIFVGD